MKNGTLLKPKQLFPFFKNWKIAYIVYTISPIILTIVLLYPFNHEKIEVLLSSKVYSKFIILYIMIIYGYFAINIHQKTSIIIDDKGIKRTFEGGFSFKEMEYQYNWNAIAKISLSRLNASVVLTLKNKSKKILIPYFAYEVKDSSIELNIPKLPKTNYGRAKFDINETAILKTLNYWKPKNLFSSDLKESSTLNNEIDLGNKIKSLAIASFVAVIIFVLSMPLSDEIRLFSGYYWTIWLIVAFVFLMIAMIITYKEIKHKSKMFGAILVSLLVAASFSVATGGVLEIYTKYEKNTEKHLFTLVETDDKYMIWKSKDDKWDNFFMKYENDFEREIKIGDTIVMDVNKGPFSIYSTSIDNFEKAVKIYDTNKSD